MKEDARNQISDDKKIHSFILGEKALCPKCGREMVYFNVPDHRGFVCVNTPLCTFKVYTVRENAKESGAT